MKYYLLILTLSVAVSCAAQVETADITKYTNKTTAQLNGARAANKVWGTFAYDFTKKKFVTYDETLNAWVDAFEGGVGGGGFSGDYNDLFNLPPLNYLPLAGGTLTGGLTTQNVLPGTNNTHDLGSLTSAFRKSYTYGNVLRNALGSGFDWSMTPSASDSELQFQRETVTGSNSFTTAYTLNRTGTATKATDLTPKSYVDAALEDGQQLSLTGNTLTLENGGTVDLSAYLDNTDGQTVTDLSLSANILSITLSGGNTSTVDLSSLIAGGGTDDQQLTLSSDILALEDGGTPIDLSGYNQTLAEVLAEGNTAGSNINMDEYSIGNIGSLALSNGSGVGFQNGAISLPGGTHNQANQKYVTLFPNETTPTESNLNFLIYNGSTNVPATLKATLTDLTYNGTSLLGGGSGVTTEQAERINNQGFWHTQTFAIDQTITAAMAKPETTPYRGRRGKLIFTGNNTATLSNVLPIDYSFLLVAGQMSDSLTIVADTGGIIYGTINTRILKADAVDAISVKTGLGVIVTRTGVDEYEVDGAADAFIAVPPEHPNLIVEMNPSSLVGAAGEDAALTSWTDIKSGFNATFTNVIRHIEGGESQADFNGTAFGTIPAANTNFIPGADEFTIMVKIGHAVAASSTAQMFFGRTALNPTTSYQYGVYVNSGIKRSTVGGPDRLGATANYSPGDVIMLTARTTGYDLYVNGVKTVDNLSVGKSTFNTNMTIGARYNGSSYNLVGSLSHLLIYDAALDATEALAEFNKID